MNKNFAIQIENLSKKYLIGEKSHGTIRHSLSTLFKKNKKEEFWALKDINLTINKGDAIGIIGRNGAGKSTLLKILSKITQPTKGRVILNGKVASLLEVGTGFHPELTGLENIFLNGSLLGMNRSEIKSKIDEIISFSGVEKFIDTPVKHYSSGMYVRLAFSVAAHLNSDILLVDEVLAVGDLEFQKKCLGKMEDVTIEQGKTAILVSHNHALINAISDKVIRIDKGEIANDLDMPLETDNLKTYKDKDIKSVKLYQNNNKIILEASYSFKGEYILPSFGFECRDRNGFYLFSYSPIVDAKQNLNKSYPSEGTIVLEILSPILQDGVYCFSFFFGDGRRNSLIDKEGLNISILNMGPFKNPNAIFLPQVYYSVL